VFLTVRCSAAHSRFQEWLQAGFFVRLWEASLHEYDELKGLLWEGKKRSQPNRQRQKRRQEEQGLCLDKGYDFGQVREVVEEFGYTAHIRT
jgi:hypothetical protein